MRIRWMMIAVIVLTSMTFSAAYAQDTQTPTEICDAASPAAASEPMAFDTAEQVLEDGVDYRAVFCTAAGPVYVDLFEDYTPITVNSFVFLAEEGFYDNTTFHRVIEQFMVQGGDPEGTGRGGPGYRFSDEFVGFLHFDRPGWLAMANAGPGTNGSQFFITTVPTPHLDFQHTIFGEVLEGQENVENLTLRDPDTAEEPGDALIAVVIVTDPDTVTTTYEPLASATQDEVAEAFGRITDLLPPEVLTVNAEVSGVFATEDLLDTMTEDVQEDYATYFDEHQHEYRATNRILNPGCDLQNIAFVSVGYSLDAYATPDDAAAALADPALNELMIADGYTQNDEAVSGLTVFTREGTSCDTDVKTALTHWQRGHFVSTVQITLPGEVEAPLDQVLSSFVGQQIFENILSDVLRPEIR